MAKLHFRPYIPNQTVLFPQRIDENIAADDPVRIVNAVVDNLNLDNFKKLYKETGADRKLQGAPAQGRCEVLQGNVMNLPFSENTFHLVTAFETIYFWPGIQVAFQQVYRVLKNGGTFLICNESNGKNTKDEKWTDIIHGMTIYTSEQIEKELENVGFSKIEVDQNQKDWLCLVCKKDD